MFHWWWGSSISTQFKFFKIWLHSFKRLLWRWYCTFAIHWRYFRHTIHCSLSLKQGFVQVFYLIDCVFKIVCWIFEKCWSLLIFAIYFSAHRLTHLKHDLIKEQGSVFLRDSEIKLHHLRSVRHCFGFFYSLTKVTFFIRSDKLLLFKKTSFTVQRWVKHLPWSHDLSQHEEIVLFFGPGVITKMNKLRALDKIFSKFILFRNINELL